MNIHSFITENYIAPLQGYYSEARLTLARLKRRVLRLEYNVSERILGSNRCDKGSPFHTEGPTTVHARAWVVEVRAKGTESNLCSDERSELQPLVPGVEQQRSRRFAGARPRIHLQTIATIRNIIRCWRGSQWSTSSMYADTCPALGMPPMRRAAVRIT